MQRERAAEKSRQRRQAALAKRQRQRRRRNPQFETLERRDLLAVLTVDTMLDGGAAEPQTSLREAILAANASPGPDSIQLSAGTFRLDISGAEEDAGATGDLDITGDLTLVGAAGGATVIDADQLDRVFDVHRGATVTLQDITVIGGDVSGVIVVGDGDVVGGVPQLGGGVRNDGDLTLRDVDVLGNTADAGGGVANFGTLVIEGGHVGEDSGGNEARAYGGGISNSGQLTMLGASVEHNQSGASGGGVHNAGSLHVLTRDTNNNPADDVFDESLIADNSASGTGGGVHNTGVLMLESSSIDDNDGRLGGGVFNTNVFYALDAAIRGNEAAMSGGGVMDFGTLTLLDSLVLGNLAEDGGGGLASGGEAFIRGSVISNNRSGEFAGGIDAFGDMTLVDSEISDNLSGQGGGIGNEGDLTIVGSLISDNQSDSPYSGGGGIQNFGQLQIDRTSIFDNQSAGGGGGLESEGDLQILASTIAGNLSTFGGAGVQIFGGLAALTNTTISSNTLSPAVNFPSPTGGGLHVLDGQVSLLNSTIAGNTAAIGGGIDARVAVQLQNTIVIGNTASDDVSTRDVSSVVDFDSLGNNLIGVAGAAGGFSAAASDILGVANPATVLDLTLVDHGGATWTHALAIGSPAINTANLADAPSADQRGLPRPDVEFVDIGAVEMSVQAAPAVDYSSYVAPSPPTMIIGDRAAAGTGAAASGDFDVSVLADTLGVASLRQAVLDANDAAGADVINLPAGDYTLSIAGANENQGQSGDLDVAGDLTIVGAVGTTIDADQLDRVFDVQPGVTLTLVNITVTGGLADFGGGLRNYGRLLLQDSQIFDNTADIGGGGIFNVGAVELSANAAVTENAASLMGGGVLNEGLLFVTGDISSNFAGFLGGGVFNSTLLRLDGATVVSNTAEGLGGGFLNLGGAEILGDSQLTANYAGEGGAIANFDWLQVRGGVFEDNEAEDSGAIHNIGEARVYDAVFVDNRADEGGGAIGNDGWLGVFDTEFTNNQALPPGFDPQAPLPEFGPFIAGGAIFNSGGLIVDGGDFEGNQSVNGGAISTDGWAQIWSSQFEANIASGAGGAIQAFEGDGLEIVLSTIDGNSAGSEGGGLAVGGTHLEVRQTTISNNTAATLGGGIYLESFGNGASADITNSTISSNSAAEEGGGVAVQWDVNLWTQQSTISGNSADEGGGLFNRGHATFKNTIVADNSAVQSGPDIGSTGLLDDHGSNLIGDTSGLSNQFSHPDTLRDLDPQLGPLASNGGLTMSHALLVNSPAIDAGDQWHGIDGLDQLGNFRLAGAGNDIGAVEFNSEAPERELLLFFDKIQVDDGPLEFGAGIEVFIAQDAFFGPLTQLMIRLPGSPDYFPLDPQRPGEYEAEFFADSVDDLQSQFDGDWQLVIDYRGDSFDPEFGEPGPGDAVFSFDVDLSSFDVDPFPQLPIIDEPLGIVPDQPTAITWHYESGGGEFDNQEVILEDLHQIGFFGAEVGAGATSLPVPDGFLLPEATPLLAAVAPWEFRDDLITPPTGDYFDFVGADLVATRQVEFAVGGGNNLELFIDRIQFGDSDPVYHALMEVWLGNDPFLQQDTQLLLQLPGQQALQPMDRIAGAPVFEFDQFGQIGDTFDDFQSVFDGTWKVLVDYNNNALPDPGIDVFFDVIVDLSLESDASFPAAPVIIAPLGAVDVADASAINWTNQHDGSAEANEVSVLQKSADGDIAAIISGAIDVDELFFTDVGASATSLPLPPDLPTDVPLMAFVNPFLRRDELIGQPQAAEGFRSLLWHPTALDLNSLRGIDFSLTDESSGENLIEMSLEQLELSGATSFTTAIDVTLQDDPRINPDSQVFLQLPGVDEPYRAVDSVFGELGRFAAEFDDGWQSLGELLPAVDGAWKLLVDFDGDASLNGDGDLLGIEDDDALLQVDVQSEGAAPSYPALPSITAPAHEADPLDNPLPFTQRRPQLTWTQAGAAADNQDVYFLVDGHDDARFQSDLDVGARSHQPAPLPTAVSLVGVVAPGVERGDLLGAPAAVGSHATIDWDAEMLSLVSAAGVQFAVAREVVEVDESTTTGQLGGGSGQEGGISFDLDPQGDGNVVAGGSFSADYFTPNDPSDTAALIGDAAADQADSVFQIPGDTAQVWSIEFSGQLAEDAVVTVDFAYNEQLLNLLPGQTEADLEVFHFDEATGQWESLNVVSRDLVNNVITVEVGSFSPFVLATVPTISVAEGATATSAGPLSTTGNYTLVASLGEVRTNEAGDGWTWSHATTDGPFAAEVTITIVDEEGTSSTSFDLIVNNVAPEPTAPASQTASEGVSQLLELGSFTDPGDDGDWEVTVDWGDGTATTQFVQAAAGSLADQPHLYSQDGDYTVTVVVAEQGGTISGTSLFTVEVQNTPPTLTPGADAEVDQGATASFQLGALADPGADGPWQIEVNWGDGSGAELFTVNTVGDLGARPHQYNAAGAFTVQVTATEQSGAGASVSSSFVVAVDAAPVVTPGPDRTVNEGDTVDFALGSFSDEALDGPWLVHVAWGDGSSDTFAVTAAGDLGTRSHTYDDDGSFTPEVTVTAQAGVGNAGSGDFDVVVENVAPVVTPGPSRTVDEGLSVEYQLGSFTDPGDDELWEINVNWGDGSDVETFEADEPGSLPARSHAYASDGSYTLFVTVAEDQGDGLSRSRSITVVVENVVPEVSADSDDVEIEEDTTATNSGSFGDAGGDAVALTVSLGDIIQDNDAGDWTWSYTPAADFHGSLDVVVTATDDVGASSQTTFTLAVTPVNDVPQAAGDQAAAKSGEATTISAASLLANDTAGPANESGQLLVIDAVSGTAQGGSVIIDSGNVVYTSAEGFSGQDSFTYTILDNGQSNSEDDFKSHTATVTVDVAPPFFLAVDFNSTNSPTADGYTGLGRDNQFDASRGFGWQRRASLLNTRLSDDLLRDGHRGSTNTFSTELPNGVYFVTMVFGNMSRVSAEVSAEGSVVLEDVSAPLRQFAVRRFEATVDDGQLDINIRRSGGRGVWTLNSLRIDPSVQTIDFDYSSGTPAAGETLVVTGEGATPDAAVTVLIDGGVLVGDDADPQLAGVQVVADELGNFQIPVAGPVVGGPVQIQVLELDGPAAGVAELVFPAPSELNFDFNNRTSPTAAGYVGVGVDYAYDSQRGYGWTGRAIIASRRGPDDLLRDGHFGKQNTFRVDLPDGVYEVTVHMGDSRAARGAVDIVAEGETVLEDVATARGEFFEDSFVTTVADGQLDIQFAHQIRGRNWIINGLEIVSLGEGVDPLTLSGPTEAGEADGQTHDQFSGGGATPGGEVTVRASGAAIVSADVNDSRRGVQVTADNDGNFVFAVRRPIEAGTVAVTARDDDSRAVGQAEAEYVPSRTRRFDFNHGASPTAEGFVGVASASRYDVDRGYGWERTSQSVNRGTGDDVVRDGHVIGGNVFMVDVPDGEYWVSVTTGDQRLARGPVDVLAEGELVGDNITTRRGEHSRLTFFVAVADGQLNLEFDPVGRRITIVNSIEFRPADATTGSLSLSGPADDDPEADGSTIDTFQGAGATADGLVNLNLSAGFVTTADADDAMAGVQVRADASGQFTFDVQRPIVPGPMVVVAEDLSVGAVVAATVDLDESQVRRFDFNRRTSPTATGFVGVAENVLYEDGAGYGWLTAVAGVDRGLGGDLNRDGHIGRSNTFMANVDNGVYEVTLTLGDRVAQRGPFDVRIEGTLRVEDLRTLQNQFVTETYVVAVNDGRLDLALDRSQSRSWMIVALEIVPIVDA